MLSLVTFLQSTLGRSLTLGHVGLTVVQDMDLRAAGSTSLDGDDRTHMERAVDAVRAGGMSLRKAAMTYGVSTSALHQQTSGAVAVLARNGPNLILITDELRCVLDAVDARTNAGQCFTSDELALFIRSVIEKSPYEREIPGTFPSSSWVNGFIRRNKQHFGRRKAQNLEACRAMVSTEVNVRSHYASLKSSMETCGKLPPSRIWNLDETGMCGQGFCNKKVVLASKGKRTNTQQSNSRDNVSMPVCVNADGGYLPPFFIVPGRKSLHKSHEWSHHRLAFRC
jgi:hypothetical protein